MRLRGGAHKKAPTDAWTIGAGMSEIDKLTSPAKVALDNSGRSPGLSEFSRLPILVNSGLMAKTILNRDCGFGLTVAGLRRICTGFPIG